MKKTIFSLILNFFFCSLVIAQPSRWQQRIECRMEIDMDVQTHQYHGKQHLTYYNNSPDTLDRVFYHLYFNAFQPGSMMDVRSRTLPDGDTRLADKIQQLKSAEQGWLKVRHLKQDGADTRFETNETILEVRLDHPVLPGDSTVLEMEWDAQVPVQIRRSGRDNWEGVAYSMSQWYPKICNYDYQGWHANPYVQREFYGVWGDFDVRIRIDSSYMVAAGGYLQNPEAVGKGYAEPDTKMNLPSGSKLMYHFVAPNVHDFVWAADPDFTHRRYLARDGITLHFIWQKGQGYDAVWEQLPPIMDRALAIMNERFGKYPYKEYYFIQGGDGGMEYPLATLITGKRPLNSLVGVAVHELLHSWYQMVLGSNESLYAWMDEGFTSYAESIVENELASEGLMEGRSAVANPFTGTYRAYSRLATSGREEPLTTHADHFKTNMAYGIGSYTKGAVFLNQLGYIIGKENLDRGLLSYFHTWKFKHPNANDMIRVFEKVSDLELDWYREDFINTTNTIDYAVISVEAAGRKSTRVTIARLGDMAMPLDILVTYSNGDQELFYAPLESMRGEKPVENNIPRTLLKDHRWVDPEYVLEIPHKMEKVVSVEIDPSGRMADIARENNVWTDK